MTFAGRDIADLSPLPLARLAGILKPYAEGGGGRPGEARPEHPEKGSS